MFFASFEMDKEILLKLDKLELKIKNLVAENFDYKQKIANFELLLKEQADLLVSKEKEIEGLKETLRGLKLGKAFAGKNENNLEAKQKIDSLIKEINLCIAALKD